MRPKITSTHRLRRIHRLKNAAVPRSRDGAKPPVPLPREHQLRLAETESPSPGWRAHSRRDSPLRPSFRDPGCPPPEGLSWRVPAPDVRADAAACLQAARLALEAEG